MTSGFPHDDSSPLYESKFGLFNFTELHGSVYDVELLKVPLPETAIVSNTQGQGGGETEVRERGREGGTSQAGS